MREGDRQTDTQRQRVCAHMRVRVCKLFIFFRLPASKNLFFSFFKEGNALRKINRASSSKSMP